MEHFAAAPDLISLYTCKKILWDTNPFVLVYGSSCMQQVNKDEEDDADDITMIRDGTDALIAVIERSIEPTPLTPGHKFYFWRPSIYTYMCTLLSSAAVRIGSVGYTCISAW